MRLRHTVLASLGLLTLGAAMVAWAHQPGDDLQRPLQELLAARVESAELCAEAMQASYEADQVVVSDVLVSLTNLRDAKLAVAQSPKEQVKVLTEHLAKVEKLEHRLKALNELTVRGGETNWYTLAKVERQTAEIALLQARIKAKQ